MKNSVKKATAAILAAMMIGTGIYAPTADNYNLFSETSITAEAASVGKVIGQHKAFVDENWLYKLSCFPVHRR